MSLSSFDALVRFLFVLLLFYFGVPIILVLIIFHTIITTAILWLALDQTLPFHPPLDFFPPNSLLLIFFVSNQLYQLVCKLLNSGPLYVTARQVC